jgi:4-oxalocrotonate tautomerase
MPFITIKAIAGRTIEQKRALVRDITNAIVKDFKVKPEHVHIDIIEFNAENRGDGIKFIHQQI